jgi:N-acetylglucosaminyl-diphospho-decaprenol L-rhamnosyltransferase
MMAKIAAITLNYRKAELTTRSIESLARQVQLVLVVDNSALDEEVKVLAERVAAIRSPTANTRVEILNPKINLGFGKGVDYGLQWISSNTACKAVLMINNDAIAHVDLVARMFYMLDTHNGTALVAPRTTGSTPSVLWYHRLFALVLKRPLLGAFPYLSGACLLVPMSLARNGLFDPQFFMYGEDVELSWRMTQHGVPLVTADAECEHTGSASSRLGSLFYEYHVARGHILLARKLAKNNFEWAALLLGRALSLPLRATLRCLRHKSLIPWSALVLAWLGKPPPPPGA